MTLTATDPLAPLTAVLGRLDQEWARLGVAADLRPDPAVRWEPLRDLAEPPYTWLRDMVARTAALRGAPDHVAAALLWKTYAYWTALPVVLGWALNRRVPLVTLTNTVVRRHDAAPYLTVALSGAQLAVLPDDPCAGAEATGTVVVADPAALGATVRRTLLDGHHRPLIRALHEITRVGERTLWGSTAEALAHPLCAFGRFLPGGPAVRPSELLDAVGEPVRGLVRLRAEPDGGIGVGRRTAACG